MAVTLLEGARGERPRRGPGDDLGALGHVFRVRQGVAGVANKLVFRTTQHVAEGRIHLDESSGHICQDHPDGSVVKGLLEAVTGRQQLVYISAIVKRPLALLPNDSPCHDRQHRYEAERHGCHPGHPVPPTGGHNLDCRSGTMDRCGRNLQGHEKDQPTEWRRHSVHHSL